MTTLLAASVGEIMGDAGLTILIGLVVVFAVLLLLTGIFKIFGLTMSATTGSREKKPQVSAAAPAPVAAPAAATIVGNTQPVQSLLEIQNGIPEETVAVISAAVASVAPAGSQYAVRSIRKA